MLRQLESSSFVLRGTFAFSDVKLIQNAAMKRMRTGLC